MDPQADGAGANAVRSIGGVLLWALVACGKGSSPAGDDRSLPGVDAESVLRDAAGLAEAGTEEPMARSARATETSDLATLVRRGDFREVERAVRALPGERLTRPENRLLFARALVENEKWKEALDALRGLDTELPLLGDEISDLRARAFEGSGAFLEASERFAKSQHVATLLRAAIDCERANLPSRAEAIFASVVASPKRTRLEEAEARAHRIQLKLGSALRDAEDARWIVVHAPDSPFAKEASKVLGRLSPERPLTGDEEVTRAKQLSLAGEVDEALLALDRAAQLGSPPGKRERLRLRAEVLVKNRARPLDAARLYEEARHLGGEAAVEDTFLAGRSLSRADHDDEAIEHYLEVERKAPSSRFAEEAHFLTARLHAIHRRWDKARSFFFDHLARYRKGEHRFEARRYLALSNLIERHFKEARAQYEALSADESDPVDASTFRYFAAVAAERDGDSTHAAAVFSDLAKEHPFDWAGLLARAHLAAEGVVRTPKVTDPSFPEATLPAPIDLLVRIGFDDEAEKRLADRDREIAFSSKIEVGCSMFLQVDRAGALFSIARRIPKNLLLGEPAAGNLWANRCAYPRPFGELVRLGETENRLPQGLVFAVMRQESQFQPSAFSPAGAIGLMQLMPETADRLQRERGKPKVADSQLREPRTNIALGARYLRAMMDQFQGRAPLAVAAYNAGPDAVKRWRERHRELELDLFVEQIPFPETRSYVMRVIGNFARYRALARPADLELPITLKE